MRLLNARNLEFVDRPEPTTHEESQYAILSHTWGVPSDEVSFKDIEAGDLQRIKHKPGLTKIRRAAKQTLRDGLEYIWVDTCCIDKSSSAELTESINSMFRWYEKASLCYVYLADVEFSADFAHQLHDSKWFTRAWTLQELIAPAKVWFFDREWTFVGNRTALCPRISAVTRIDAEALLHDRPLRLYSVAQRMSWAARRKATRVEDIAYSLLGIFDVNMPMLYGEGPKAFMRLQEEIIKSSTDHSIFAWDTEDAALIHLLLAPSPEYFDGADDIVRIPATGHRSYQLTNNGLNIELDILRTSDGLLAALNCEGKGSHSVKALRLKFAYTFQGTQSGSPNHHNAYFVGPESHTQTVKRVGEIPLDWVNFLRLSLCRMSVLRGTRPEDVEAARAFRRMPEMIFLWLSPSIAVEDVFQGPHWSVRDGCLAYEGDKRPTMITGALRLTPTSEDRRTYRHRAIVAFGIRKSEGSILKWIHADSYAIASEDTGSMFLLSDACGRWSENSESIGVLGGAPAVYRLNTSWGHYKAEFECNLIRGEMVGTLSITNIAASEPQNALLAEH